MANSSTGHGDGGAWPALRTALRQLFAVLLMASTIAVTTHHLGCSCADASEAASVSVSADVPVAPDQDQCAPGHCHCLCHVVTERVAGPASKPVEFADAIYAGRDTLRLWSVSVGPPFEPPCV